MTLMTQTHPNRVVPMGIDQRLVQRAVCYSRVVVPALWKANGRQEGTRIQVGSEALTTDLYIDKGEFRIWLRSPGTRPPLDIISMF